MSPKIQMKKLNISVFVGVLLSLAAGCGASVTTPELRNARSLMAQAKAGEAARRNPDELRVAERDLAAAEAAHEEDPGSVVERDRAYIADRRIRIAMANARRSAVAEHARTEESRYTQQLEQTARAQSTQIEATQDQLALTRDQVRSGTQQLNATNQTLRTREQQLAAEREARVAAENDLAATVAELNEIASVREDQENLIITLSNTVLFPSGQSTLLPDAERRLAAVAAVIRNHPDRSVTVVGHTDSAGSSASNEALSLARANSVRARFAQGAPEAHIEAVGMGESQPIADNARAEGRANNRRVEIILHRATQQAAAPRPTAATR